MTVPGVAPGPYTAGVLSRCLRPRWSRKRIHRWRVSRRMKMPGAIVCSAPVSVMTSELLIGRSLGKGKMTRRWSEVDADMGLVSGRDRDGFPGIPRGLAR